MEEFQSGSREFPTPSLLVERMLADTATVRQCHWVTFATKPIQDFVEVTLEGADELVAKCSQYAKNQDPFREWVG